MISINFLARQRLRRRFYQPKHRRRKLGPCKQTWPNAAAAKSPVRVILVWEQICSVMAIV
ncbi:MAG: hypothetical protein QNK73_05765 [Emcibacteraceae bacterium]